MAGTLTDEACLRERIKAELSTLVLKEDFSFPDPRSSTQHTQCRPYPHTRRLHTPPSPILKTDRLFFCSAFYVTDKPTNMKLSTFTSDDDLPAEYLAVAETLAKTPKEKYDFPQTEAQEIGWYADQVVPPTEASLRRFSHRSVQSEMTKHANSLTTSNWQNIRR